MLCYAMLCYVLTYIRDRLELPLERWCALDLSGALLNCGQCRLDLSGALLTTWHPPNRPIFSWPDQRSPTVASSWRPGTLLTIQHSSDHPAPLHMSDAGLTSQHPPDLPAPSWPSSAFLTFMLSWPDLPGGIVVCPTSCGPTNVLLAIQYPPDFLNPFCNFSGSLPNNICTGHFGRSKMSFGRSELSIQLSVPWTT